MFFSAYNNTTSAPRQLPAEKSYGMSGETVNRSSGFQRYKSSQSSFHDHAGLVLVPPSSSQLAVPVFGSGGGVGGVVAYQFNHSYVDTALKGKLATDKIHKRDGSGSKAAAAAEAAAAFWDLPRHPIGGAGAGPHSRSSGQSSHMLGGGIRVQLPLPTDAESNSLLQFGNDKSQMQAA